MPKQFEARVSQFLLTLDSTHTRSAYESDLAKFQEWWKGTYEVTFSVAGITRVHVREWRNWMKSRYAVSTINRRLAALSSFLAWCVEREYIQTNPARRVKKLKQQNHDIKWLTPADEGRVIRYVESQHSVAQNMGTAAGKRQAARDCAIAYVLMYAGLRASELCGLDLGDVEISERRGHVTVLGKGNKERAVNLNADVRGALRDWLKLRPEVGHEALFIGQRGDRLSTGGLRKLIKRMVEKASLKDAALDDVSPHTFRHTWIKRMMDDVSVPDLEIPLNVILDLAGHASADSLKPYTVSSAHDRQRAVERLGFGV
ncbi:MAG: tyrosine-type recombinase/integrase, partial [Chloroflexota bacterium]|nr:tyrosine-type recombinase/integrase [Chloroflexota bacterium]